MDSLFFNHDSSSHGKELKANGGEEQLHQKNFLNLSEMTGVLQFMNHFLKSSSISKVDLSGS